MHSTQDYIVSSLELHLFFARIMKEHAFFLKVGLLPPNAELAREGEQLLRQFEGLLSRAIALSDRVISCRVLDSGELVTEFTDMAERQTQHFTGTFLNRSLTARTKQLRGRSCGGELNASQNLVCRVRQLNREGLALVDRIINYKERLLRGVDSCQLFTVNYPLLIEHILREARLYRAWLRYLEGLDSSSCRELQDMELFWNRIMMEHALFIRGLLDPTQEELISTSDGFARDYRRLLEACDAANSKTIGRDSLELTRNFRDFKCAGVKGIEACEIRSIILPLLADHVLREANHYIRLLEE